MKRLFILATVCGFILLVGATGAWADSMAIGILNIGNSAISGYAAGYAQIMIDLTSSTMATITFTSLSSADGNIYLLGGHGAVAINVNASSWDIDFGAITASNAGTGFSPPSYSDGGSVNVSGFGSFNQTIDGFDGFTHSGDNISFNLSNTAGTWADATDVLITNNKGEDAGAHIFVTSTPANASNGALAIGFAVDNDVTAVPEPSLLILLGIGVGAVSLLAYRFKI